MATNQNISDHAGNYTSSAESRKSNYFPTPAPDPNAGRIGALATMQAPTDTSRQQTGSAIDSNPTAPSSIGDLASPSTMGTEAPPGSPDELNSRIARNTAFLQDPTTKAQLVQFGMSMLASAGRGNLGGNIGQALSLSAALPGRLKEMNLKAANTMSEMDVRNRSQAVEEQRLAIEKQRLQMDVVKAGGMNFSRVISPDDPLNERFQLGLKPGDKPARVDFLANPDGTILKAEIQGPYDTSNAGANSSIPDLLSQADAAEKAGKPQEAALLRTEAQTKATGPGGMSSKGGIITPDTTPGNTTGVKVDYAPGSEGDIAAKAAAKISSTAEAGSLQAADIVTKKIDHALGLLDNSVAPNVFVTGLGEYLSYLPASEAKDMKTTLDTIRGNITTQKLSEMRAGSKNGAAVGNVSNFEDEMFGSLLGSMDQGMSASQMRENLVSIRALYDDIINKGTLTSIGRQVDNGTMSPQDGMQHAAELLSTEGIHLMDPQTSDLKTGKDEQPIPIPDAISGFTKEQYNRVRLQWDKMDNATRRKFLD